MVKHYPLKIFQQDLMAIFNGFSHINGILMAFLFFLMACEYSSESGTQFMKHPVPFMLLKFNDILNLDFNFPLVN